MTANYEALEQLISHIVDVNSEWASGKTLVLQLCEKLVEIGCEINISHGARCVKLSLRAGADLDARRRGEHLMPLEFACVAWRNTSPLMDVFIEQHANVLKWKYQNEGSSN